MKNLTKSFLAALLVLAFSIPVYSQTTTSLEPGKSIEQTIAGGETHTYNLTFAKGSYGLIEVDQKSINLSITVFAADGLKLRVVELIGAGFLEQLSLIAGDTTNYRIEVHSPDKASPSGGYAIKLKETHPATDQHKARVEAEKLTEAGIYETNIDVLMRLHQQRPTEGFAVAALEVSEKSRARSLLELLREARAEIEQGVDPSLIERESYLRRSIANKAEQQIRLLSGKYTEQEASAIAKELNALTTDYDQVQSRIRQASPRYAALLEPQPIDVEEIRKRVVDADTLLLEYSLGEEKSFLWAVTPDTVKSFELPGRATIEQSAKRVYQLLTERGTSVSGETIAQRKVRLERADSEYMEAAAALSRMLLGPVASELKQKRLAIVAEGVLQYVSFSALPSPVSGATPLIVDHEIVTLPSASVLAVLREETVNRKPASKAVAVLADPVFSASDPRVAKNGAAPVDDSSSLVDAQRSAAESGLKDLVRLRFSRQEAEEIARLAGNKSNLKALDFAANRAVAMDQKLSDYRIVHFATHGLINNQHPDLSGVVLSLVDAQGRPQNGFLRLYDIYNLKLDAELVVLSACQTALGKEIKGEGLVGLTRGFMYAGAPRVVASLWRIDDRASADIMSRFYAAMLKDGLRPAAALRAAQVSMLREKRWQSPHYWAAFTIQGEWR